MSAITVYQFSWKKNPNVEQSYSPDEAVTRQNIIDRWLAEAGWSVVAGNLIEELPLLLSPERSLAETAHAVYRTPTEFSDYGMLGRNGKPLAIIEAKRTSRGSESDRS